MKTETLIMKTLPSGMSCYIIPRVGYVTAQAMVCVRYGSMDVSFAVNGVRRSTPGGTAHFLEHKMFENASGVPGMFAAFAALGADVNAFTNFRATAYTCAGTINFTACLRTLLAAVLQNGPHITDENVEKEGGIIKQEIRMYNDDPYWVSYFDMLGALYHDSPVRAHIAGTEADVDAITKETLLDCYDVFYRPQNMAVICAGDFAEPDAVFDVVERTVPQKVALDAARARGEERAGAAKEFTRRVMGVTQPVFHIGIKDAQPYAHTPREMAAARLALELLCGEGSTLYAALYDDGLIDNGFHADYQTDDTYGVSLLAGVSNVPQKVYEALLRGIERLKAEGVVQSDFEHVKRKQCGRFLRGLNSLDAVLGAQCACFIRGTDINAMREAYETVALADVQERLLAFGAPGSTSLAVVEGGK